MGLFFVLEDIYSFVWRRQTLKWGISVCQGEFEFTGCDGIHPHSSFPVPPPILLTAHTIHYVKPAVPHSQSVEVTL